MEIIKEYELEKKGAQGPEAWQASFRHTWKCVTDQWRTDELILEETADENDGSDSESETREGVSNSGGEPADVEAATSLYVPDGDREAAGPPASDGKRAVRPNPRFADPAEDSDDVSADNIGVARRIAPARKQTRGEESPSAGMSLSRRRQWLMMTNLPTDPHPRRETEQ